MMLVVKCGCGNQTPVFRERSPGEFLFYCRPCQTSQVTTEQPVEVQYDLLQVYQGLKQAALNVVGAAITNPTTPIHHFVSKLMIQELEKWAEEKPTILKFPASCHVSLEAGD